MSLRPLGRKQQRRYDAADAEELAEELADRMHMPSNISARFDTSYELAREFSTAIRTQHSADVNTLCAMTDADDLDDAQKEALLAQAAESALRTPATPRDLRDAHAHVMHIADGDEGECVAMPGLKRAFAILARLTEQFANEGAAAEALDRIARLATAQYRHLKVDEGSAPFLPRGNEPTAYPALDHRVAMCLRCLSAPWLHLIYVERPESRLLLDKMVRRGVKQGARLTVEFLVADVGAALPPDGLFRALLHSVAWMQDVLTLAQTPPASCVPHAPGHGLHGLQGRAIWRPRLEGRSHTAPHRDDRSNILHVLGAVCAKQCGDLAPHEADRLLWTVQSLVRQLDVDMAQTDALGRTPLSHWTLFRREMRAQIVRLERLGVQHTTLEYRADYDHLLRVEGIAEQCRVYIEGAAAMPPPPPRPVQQPPQAPRPPVARRPPRQAPLYRGPQSQPQPQSQSQPQPQPPSSQPQSQPRPQSQPQPQSQSQPQPQPQPKLPPMTEEERRIRNNAKRNARYDSEKRRAEYAALKENDPVAYEALLAKRRARGRPAVPDNSSDDSDSDSDSDSEAGAAAGSAPKKQATGGGGGRSVAQSHAAAEARRSENGAKQRPAGTSRAPAAKPMTEAERREASNAKRRERYLIVKAASNQKRRDKAKALKRSDPAAYEAMNAKRRTAGRPTASDSEADSDAAADADNHTAGAGGAGARRERAAASSQRATGGGQSGRSKGGSGRGARADSSSSSEEEIDEEEEARLHAAYDAMEAEEAEEARRRSLGLGGLGGSRGCSVAQAQADTDAEEEEEDAFEAFDDAELNTPLGGGDGAGRGGASRGGGRGGGVRSLPLPLQQAPALQLLRLPASAASAASSGRSSSSKGKERARD